MYLVISNTVQRFQDYMNKIIVEKIDIFDIVYLNHIFIHIKDPS